MPLGVLHILNPTITAQKFSQCRFPFDICPTSQIVSVGHKQIERKGSGARSIVDTAVQCLEVRNALGIKPNHLCIEYRGTFESRPRFDDQRIAL